MTDNHLKNSESEPMYQIASVTFVQAGDLLDIGLANGPPQSDEGSTERVRPKTQPATSDASPQPNRRRPKLAG